MTVWTGQKVGTGLLKVGYTEQQVIDRVSQQFPIITPNKNPFEIVFEDVAMSENGKFFKDNLVHTKLIEKGFKRVNGEWFECTIEDLKAAILEIKTGQKIEGNRYQDFPLRPEQAEAVSLTAEYFKKFSKEKEKAAPHFLWNAKMRFGKTFTSYKLAKEMGWTRLIVLTYKPAVAAAWRDDLMDHVDFEGWQFIDKNTDFKNDVDEDKPFVWFASFQDILGKTNNGKIKERLELAHLIDWDCVILDEYHFGAWRDGAKDLYDKETAKEADLDADLEEEFSENSFPLSANNFLYLSGTPFRAMSAGEFTEDQIYNWTYSDEQRAKTSWNDRDGENPYSELPQIVLMTYQLPEKVREVALSTDQNEFDLNLFFKATEKDVDGKKEFIFNYENQVQQWLNIIRGSDQIFKNVSLETNTKPPLPFEDANLLSALNHTFWFLPDVASCKAMARLLSMPNNIFYHEYKIIVSAGSEAGSGLAALTPVKENIGRGFNTKTITLSCGKLTTGVSVPQWSGVFFLRSITSPETYFQAAFRVQTPWYIRNADVTDKQRKEIIKPICYVFDFSPNRALNLISEYSSRLDINDTRKAEQRVQEFLNFLPVLCYDGSTMQALNAIELLDIAVTGVASTMLAKRWQSHQLIDVSDITLARLLDNKEVLEALEKIEAFRNLSNDISKVISSEKAIDKLKKEKVEKPLTEKQEEDVKKEEKENKGFKKRLREKLLKFITRVPVFMYLTDYREETLRDVITELEPELFTKVTGLSIKDFETMCEIGVFRSDHLNSAIFAFKRFEQASLNYVGGNELSESDTLGGFDSKIKRSELDQVIEGVK
jgi:hypothetical protein